MQFYTRIRKNLKTKTIRKEIIPTYSILSIQGATVSRLNQSKCTPCTFIGIGQIFRVAVTFICSFLRSTPQRVPQHESFANANTLEGVHFEKLGLHLLQMELALSFIAILPSTINQGTPPYSISNNQGFIGMIFSPNLNWTHIVGQPQNMQGGINIMHWLAAIGGMFNDRIYNPTNQ